MAKINFSVTDAPQQTSGNEPKPAGTYVMQVVNSDMRNTKSGSGQYLWLEFDILDGPARGKYWDRLNIINDNAKAVEIANRQLAAICHALGFAALDDSEKLHFKPLRVQLKVREAKDGSLQNEAKYLPLEAAPAAAPATAPAAAASAKPWERKK
jgi:hypothetical protein